MQTGATLNVRLNKSLKQRGDAVLEREGISTTTAVRKLYQYLDQSQAAPTWMTSENTKDSYEQRRQTMRSLVGIISLPDNFDGKTLRDERLARYDFGEGM